MPLDLSNFAKTQDDNSELPLSVVLDAASIDLCRGFGIYAGVTPGSDITTQLQAAYTQAQAAGGGDIYFSVPGNYLLNGAMQSWSAQGVSGNAQVLLPPQAMSSNVVAINLKGVRSGPGNPGGYNGVSITSNSTTAGGFMIGVEPGSLVNTKPFSNYNLTFEDIQFVTPANPQIGCVDALYSARYQHRNTMFTVGSRTALGSLTGTTPALRMPGAANSAVSGWDGYTYFDNFPTAWVLGEHGRYRGNIYVGNCLNAIQAGGSVIENVFDVVHMSNCQTGINANGTNATIHGTISWEPGGITSAILVNDPTNQIAGDLFVTFSGMPNTVGSIASVGALLLNITPIQSAGGNYSPGIGQSGSGWMSSHPADNFSRLIAESSTSAFTASTWHPCRLDAGGVTRTQSTATTGKIQSTNGAGETRYMYPVKNSGVSRRATAVFTTSAGSYRPRLHLNRVRGGSTNEFILDFNAGTVTLYVNGTQRASGGTLAASTTYTLVARIAVNASGNAWLIRIYLNGALIITYALSASEQTSLAPGTQFPYLEDGLAWFSDTSSSFGSFVVIDDTPDSTLALQTATATRTAFHYERTLCTSGTFTLTLPLPVNSVENVVTNTGAGTITVTPPSGTLSNLSGATGNITLVQGASARIVSDGTNYFQVA